MEIKKVEISMKYPSKWLIMNITYTGEAIYENL